MALIQYAAPWDRQPQEGVDLDRGGEFFNNLVVAAPFNPSLPMRDLVSGRSITATGLGSRIVTANGLYHSFGSSNYADLPQPPEITSGTQPITIAWTQQPVATSGYSTILTWKVSGAAKPFLIYQSATDAAYYFSVGPRDGAGNAVKFGAAVGAVTNGALDKFLLVCLGGVSSTNASDYVLYRNGEAFTSADKAAFGNSSSTAFRVGATETGGDPFEGAIGDFCIWNEAFGAEKAQRYQNFQWRLYAPQAILVPVSAGGGGTTISATPGNAVADGPTASVACTIPATPGNAAADGATAAVTRTIAATPGNAAADGVTATISTAGTTTISCTPGNATADGALAAITRTIAAAPGNAVADGVTAAVQASVTISCTPGNAVADGVAATVTAAVSQLDLILKILRNRQELNPSTGKFVLYDDDGATVLMQSNAWADVGGTQPYSGGTLARIDALI